MIGGLVAEDTGVEIRRLISELDAIEIEGDAFGTLGYLAGALFGLLRAHECGFEVRYVSDKRKQELLETVTNLAAGREPNQRWEARFHFNSALHRIAACADRMTIAIHGEFRGKKSNKRRGRARRKLFKGVPEAEIIYKSVNRLKHAPRPRETGLHITMDQALAAVQAVLATATQQWPGRA